MNAYEQLQTIREELEDREAGPETLRLVDRAIALAEREKDNPLSISQSMMLRHLLKMPEAANNHYIQMDLEALQGDIADRRARRDDDVPDATIDSEHQVEVRAGTQDGAVLKISGFGVPHVRSGRRGDQLCVVRVVVPTHLDARERKLYEDLGNREGRPAEVKRGFFDSLKDAFR